MDRDRILLTPGPLTTTLRTKLAMLKDWGSWDADFNTLPGAKYGLISRCLVVFTLVITDFGIPKVIGGNFNVLATDVFKLVIGQQDFQKGAVVALLLLAPAVLTFSGRPPGAAQADGHAQRARRALPAEARAAGSTRR